MPAKYRIGVIGHTGRGNYGHGIDRGWLEISGCQIVAVADSDDRGRAAKLKQLQVSEGYADYRAMLEKAKPDIVSICPRHVDQHRDMAVAAAERGVHIYMEKPFCRTPQEADQIVAACQKHDVKLALAHQTRYSPKLHVAKEIVEDGRLGQLLELRGRGKEDRRGGGEDLWVLGSHIMSFIHYFGGEPTSCRARVLERGKPVTKEHVKEGAEGIGPLAGDNVAAMYEMPEGATAYFASRQNAGSFGRRFGLQIYGSRGVLEVLTGHLPAIHFLADPTWSPGRSKKAWQPVTSAGVGKPEPLKDGGLHTGNVLACKDLIAAIEEDREPECNMHEGRLTVEMISAVFESHRLGRPAELPLKSRGNPLTLLK